LSNFWGSVQTRGGSGIIQSVPCGQAEGAMTLGLRGWQVLWLVILPQAMRLIVQPMSGVYVMRIKRFCRSSASPN